MTDEKARKPITDDANPDDDPDVDTIEHIWARTAARVAVISAGAAMVSACTGGVSYLIALPLGLLSLSLGWRAYQGAPKHSATRAYAKMAMFVSGVSVGVGAAFLVFIGMYTAMIFGLIFLGNM